MSYGALLVLVALVALPRLYLVCFYPEVAGDSDNYKNVAANLLRGCGLSMSPASGPECIPHQGGQNFPGLPFFIAFVWLLFGRSDMAILLTQLCLYLVSVAWLLIVVARFEKGERVAGVLALLLAVSPMTMPWVRFVAITEVLSIAASIWVLAEILLSLQTERLQALRMGVAFTAAVFMRVENVLFALPIGLTALYTWKHDIRRRAAVFLVTASVPFAVFMIRNILVGLPPVSSPAAMYSYAVPIYPHGFLSWLDTWMVSEYERADAIMGVWTRRYSRILIQNSPYLDPGERARANALLNELRAYDDRAFPVRIDDQFMDMARRKRSEQSVWLRLGIYLKRARTLWLNPYSSYGFPIESENREHRAALLKELEQPGPGKYVTMLRRYPAEVVGRGLIVLDKGFLLVGFVLSLLLLRTGKPLLRKIVALVFVTVVSRTVLLVLLSSPPELEARYVVSVVPWLEVLLAFTLILHVGRRFETVDA